MKSVPLPKLATPAKVVCDLNAMDGVDEDEVKEWSEPQTVSTTGHKIVEFKAVEPVFLIYVCVYVYIVLDCDTRAELDGSPWS